jgi:hypothetical protein
MSCLGNQHDTPVIDGARQITDWKARRSVRPVVHRN